MAVQIQDTFDNAEATAAADDAERYAAEAKSKLDDIAPILEAIQGHITEIELKRDNALEQKSGAQSTRDEASSYNDESDANPSNISLLKSNLNNVKTFADTVSAAKEAN